MKKARQELVLQLKNLIKIYLPLSIILLGVLLLDFTNAASVTLTEKRMNDLRFEIQELQSQAEQYKSNILDKQKDAASLNREISILNSQIRNLELELSRTQKEIDLTNVEIVQLTDKISETESDIENTRGAIGTIVREIYESDDNSIFLILLSSDNLSDFTSQAHYVSDINKRLKENIEDLKREKIALESTHASMTSKKYNLEELKNQDALHKESLDESKGSKNNLLVATKGEESKYKNLLSKIEQQQYQFMKELEVLEREAVQNKAIIVDISVDNLPKPGTKLFDYPYSKYVITQKYGRTSYASRAYSSGRHSGVDFVSGYGSPIRSIGAGYILASGANSPGWGNWVAVHHDNDFVSVYAHMRIPTPLSNGTRVDNNVVIGYEGSTGNSTGSHLHLSLYKKFFTYINPKNGLLYFNYLEGTVNPLDYIR